MKATINKILSPFGIELHGKGYMRKLSTADRSKDAFRSQQSLVKNARVIFDVGANRGNVTAKYAEMYPSATIHAFEPFRDFEQEFLSRHGNNTNISWINKALSDSVSVADYYVNKSADTNSLYKSTQIGASSDKSCTTIGKLKVQTETIDTYCTTQGIDAIDILKLDTQGAELAILKGAQELLMARRIKLIYLEAYLQPQYENSPLLFDIANYLKSRGYFLEDIYEPYYNERFLLWCDTIFIPKEQ